MPRRSWQSSRRFLAALLLAKEAATVSRKGRPCAKCLPPRRTCNDACGNNGGECVAPQSTNPAHCCACHTAPVGVGQRSDNKLLVLNAAENLDGVPARERLLDISRAKAKGWTFAIYTYNFGNFRNEVNDTRLVPLLNSYSDFGMDLFVYTGEWLAQHTGLDSCDFVAISVPYHARPSDKPAELSGLLGWKVVYHPVPAPHNTIPGTRIASKKLKWTPPKELLAYTYLIHTDMSYHTLAILNRWLHYGWLIKEILRQPDISVSSDFVSLFEVFTPSF